MTEGTLGPQAIAEAFEGDGDGPRRFPARAAKRAIDRLPLHGAEEPLHRRVWEVPRRRCKLSPMVLQARARWVDYSRARVVMLQHTSTEHAPWHIVNANVKKNPHLNVITHLLSLIPYENLTPEHLELPPRQEAGDYRHPYVSQLNIVPAIYP